MRSVSARRVLRVTGVVACAAWLPILVLWGPAPFTITFDDAYYYFTIARHIAAGDGSTFDGINLTNGYHPLWMAICVVPYLLGLAGLAAVRAILVFQLAVWAVSVWIIATIAGDAIDDFPRLDDRPRRIATAAVAGLFALLVANPFVMKTFVNGLESGVAGLVAAVLLGVAVRRDAWLVGDSRRQQLAVGVLFAVAFLARTDAVFLIAAAFGGAVLRSGAKRWRDLVVAFAPSALVAALYMTSNQVFFGNPLQVSGVVKRLPVTGGRATALLVAGGVALGVLLAASRLGPGTGRFARTRRLFASTGWFASGCVVLTAYYRLLSIETYLWYYAPLVLYGIVVALHVVADLLEGAAVEAPPHRSPHRQVLLFAALLSAPLLAGFVLSARAFVDPELRSLTEGDRAGGEWLRSMRPRDAVAASWDAGVVAYFAERPIVNIDGLVNSFEFERALRHRPDATKRFLARNRVTFVVNHGLLVGGTDPDIVEAVDALFGPGVGEGAVQVHRVEYMYAGRSAGRSRGRRPWATFVYRLPDEPGARQPERGEGGHP